MTGIVHDIIERKAAEVERVLQSEIFRNMSEGVYLISVNDGRILYTNRRFEEIFGYEPGEMEGRHVSIVNAPTSLAPDETVDLIVGILKDSGFWRGEIQNIRKDGTPFWCYASASLFEHPDLGEVIVSVHTDITERMTAEQRRKLLVQELDHRVKNTLAAILSLIGVTARSAGSTESFVEAFTSGVGLSLVTGLIEAEIGGGLNLDFPSTGARHELRIPRAHEP